MAAITTGMQSSFEKNTITEFVGRIYDSLDEESKARVVEWMPNIEEYSKHLIDGLRPKDTQRRRIDVLIAAAVYDAFLEFESRTNTTIGFPLLENVFNLKICTINSTWSRLFDNRAKLSLELLDMVYLAKDQSVADGVCLVIRKLEKAVTEKSIHIQEWLHVIQKNALDLNDELDKDLCRIYDPMVVAVVLIYAAMKFHHGKFAIKIAQQNLADLSGYSTSQVSKCWVDLFGP